MGWQTWPEGPKTARRCRRNLGAVLFYDVVSDEIRRVIEFFPSRDEAELMLARVLRDELDWHNVLHVEPIELRTGTAN